MTKYYNIPNKADQELRNSGKKKNIISFNGQGRSGKTTQAKCLVKAKSDSGMEKCFYVLCHTLRDNFKKNFYGQLAHSDQQLQQEVIGIPSLPWLVADFHWRIKPLLLDDYFIVYDHYLADYYADILPNSSAKNFQSFVKENLAIPHFKHGTHFYLDIDFDEYQKRGQNRKGTEWFTVNSKDLFEERRVRYQELCDLGYLQLINANADKSTVFEDIQRILERRIGNNEH